MNEHHLQTLVVNFLRLRMPEDFFIYTIPNGAWTKNYGVARKLKNEGLVKGMPDLHIPIARDGYNSYYIEMKSATGRMSKEQKIIKELLEKHGNKVDCFNNFRDAVLGIINYYDASLINESTMRLIERFEGGL